MEKKRTAYLLITARFVFHFNHASDFKYFDFHSIAFLNDRMQTQTKENRHPRTVYLFQMSVFRTKDFTFWSTFIGYQLHLKAMFLNRWNDTRTKDFRAVPSLNFKCVVFEFSFHTLSFLEETGCKYDRNKNAYGTFFFFKCACYLPLNVGVVSSFFSLFDISWTFEMLFVECKTRQKTHTNEILKHLSNLFTCQTLCGFPMHGTCF